MVCVIALCSVGGSRSGGQRRARLAGHGRGSSLATVLPPWLGLPCLALSLVLSFASLHCHFLAFSWSALVCFTLSFLVYASLALFCHTLFCPSLPSTFCSGFVVFCISFAFISSVLSYFYFSLAFCFFFYLSHFFFERQN